MKLVWRHPSLLPRPPPLFIQCLIILVLSPDVLKRGVLNTKTLLIV